MEIKITKKNYFTALVNLAHSAELYFEDADGNHVVITADQLAEWATKEIAMLDAKGEKAKARAAAKRAESDELTEVVASVLTDEFTGIADITAKISGPDVSVAKVANRLKRLVDANRAEKGSITIPGGEGVKARTLVAYKAAN